MAQKHLKAEPPKKAMTKLIGYEKESSSLNKVISALLYEQSQGTTYQQIVNQVKRMNKPDKTKIIESFLRIRKNRRQRPPRAFELVSYTFDLITNFGMFRDLHRHRALTLERQLLTTDHGYTIPPEVKAIGMQQEFKDSMEKSREVFNRIRKRYPEQAQYVVNFAYNYPYFIHLNLREATHMIELRTTPQGHADYRKVAQDMFKEIQKVHPTLSKIIKFVDLKQYHLERFEAEKRTERKKLKKRIES